MFESSHIQSVRRRLIGGIILTLNTVQIGRSNLTDDFRARLIYNPLLNKYEDTKRVLAMCEKVYLAKGLDATPCFQIVFNDDYFWL